MAMFRGFPPFIEPIDSDKKDEGGKIKYWRLREILPSGFTLPTGATPSSSQLLLGRSTSHFQLQNNYWSLTAHLNVIDYCDYTLTIKLHREYSPIYYATHTFAEPRDSLADLFTVLIGIVGESGEVAVEKAKPLGRFGFEVYRLIDQAELRSILKSKAPYFLFVEIETKDITEEKQKARERKKERKNYPCERFENALRICNGTLPDPDISNASPPAMMGRSIMRPPTMMSPPGMRSPTMMSHLIMRPPTMPLPSVVTETHKYVTPSSLHSSLNSSLPTSSNSSTPATKTTVMFPSKSMSSAVNGTPTFAFPSTFPNPSFPNSTPSLPARPPNPSLPTSNISHSFSNQLEEEQVPNDRCERFENALSICNGTFPDPDISNASPPAMMGRSIMRPPTMMSPPGMRSPTMMSHLIMRPPTMPLPSVVKETHKYVTPSSLDPSLNSSLPTSSNSSTPATTTTVMFPSKSMSSAVNGTPTFAFPSTFPNPSFPNSTPSLPARPPNPSLPTSNISHSFSNQLEEEQVPNDHAQSLEHDVLELDPATFLERYLSTTTTPGLFPSIKIPSAIKETSPSLNTSLFKSPASLPARPPNPSLPTTKTRKFQMDYKDLLLSGKGSDFTIIVKDMKFHAHKIILGTRSSVFLAMTEPELSITDVDPAIFREFLLYLYTGSEEHIDWKNIMELYKLGDKYCVVDLKELCLERMKTNLSMDNFFEIFMLSRQPNNAELTEVTIQFFLENSKEIIESERYKGFMHDYPDKAHLLNVLGAYASYKFLIDALEPYRKAKQ